VELLELGRLDDSHELLERQPELSQLEESFEHELLLEAPSEPPELDEP
jgi:hypothetical protein